MHHFRKIGIERTTGQDSLPHEKESFLTFENSRGVNLFLKGKLDQLSRTFRTLIAKSSKEKGFKIKLVSGFKFLFCKAGLSGYPDI